MQKELEIIYNDPHLIAINKPAGLATHRSKLVGNTNEFALQILRDQIGKYVYPIHRLDRKTSGVLLFTTTKEDANAFQILLKNHQIIKIYYAIVRGFFPERTVLNYPLKNEDGKIQDAETRFQLLEHSEVDVPCGQHNTSRYSLVEAIPVTGRMHQIRKHFSHLNHPIIGDRPHGCNKQNKLFKEKWGMINMLLHAHSVEFDHPVSKERIKISAPFPTFFKDIKRKLKFGTFLS